MGARWEIDRLHAHGFEHPVHEVTVAAVDGGAVLRQVTAGPGSAVVSDVSADGQLLLTRGDVRISLRGQVPQETEEREFPWLDSSIFPAVSRDGRYIAFEDFSQSAGADYQVALRDVAADTVVRLWSRHSARPVT